MKLQVELTPVLDTSADKLLSHSGGADNHAQLKLTRDRLSFYHDGHSYAVPLTELLTAFVAQHPAHD